MGLFTEELKHSCRRALGMNTGSLQQSLSKDGLQSKMRPLGYDSPTLQKAHPENLGLASPSKQREGTGVRVPSPEANQASPLRVHAGLDWTRVEPGKGQI